jgi:hypothetical protein
VVGVLVVAELVGVGDVEEADTVTVRAVCVVGVGAVVPPPPPPTPLPPRVRGAAGVVTAAIVVGAG